MPFDLNDIATRGAAAYELQLHPLDGDRFEVSVLAIACAS